MVPKSKRIQKKEIKLILKYSSRFLCLGRIVCFGDKRFFPTPTKDDKEHRKTYPISKKDWGKIQAFTPIKTTWRGEISPKTATDIDKLKPYEGVLTIGGFDTKKLKDVPAISFKKNTDRFVFFDNNLLRAKKRDWFYISTSVIYPDKMKDVASTFWGLSEIYSYTKLDGFYLRVSIELCSNHEKKHFQKQFTKMLSGLICTLKPSKPIYTIGEPIILHMAHKDIKTRKITPLPYIHNEFVIKDSRGKKRKFSCSTGLGLTDNTKNREELTASNVSFRGIFEPGEYTIELTKKIQKDFARPVDPVKIKIIK
jgi:hypothetical protein